MKRFLLPVALLLTIQSAIAEDKTATKPTELTMDMVSVKGGKFDLGNDSEAVDRRPAHTVNLKDFSIGKYEVTAAQWEAIMGSNPSSYYECSSCPVTNVSWNEIQVFLEKLNAKTGRHFRLPTEAEWEFAARGGVNEHMKTGSDGKKIGNKFSGRWVLQYGAWFQRNSRDHVHPVGKKAGNQLEIHDMTGNVEEWVNDWYGKDYFTSREVSNPTGQEGGISKVVRGGSWISETDEISVTRRAAYLPTTKSVYLGFRVAE